MSEELRLAFGSGHLNLHEQGYKNVDIRQFEHVDVVTDVSKKLPWDSNSVDEILAESILEHIPHGFLLGGLSYASSHVNTTSVLTEWNRVLVPGGLLKIKVPNVLGLISQYMRKNIKPRDFWMYMYGGQEYKDNIHYCGFDPETLTNCLMLAGFVNIKITNAHTYDGPLAENDAWEMGALAYKKA